MRVLVLGAGIIGVSAAWFLREAGAEVTVLEAREGPGLETSFANGGHISIASGPWAAPDVPGKMLKWLGREDAPLLLRPFRWDPALWSWGARFLANCNAADYAANAAVIGALCRFSAAETGRLREALAIADEASFAGTITLCTTAAEMAAAAAKEKRLREAGFEAELLDPAGIAAAEPALAEAAPSYAGGLFSRDGETADAYLFTRALADAAAQTGVTFRYGARVARLAVSSGAVTGVVLEGGETITAEQVVLAAGSWSVQLAATAGVRVPVYPGKGYSATVPIAGRNGAPRMAVVDEHAKIYVARFGDRLRAAGTLELAGWDKTPAPARAAATVATLKRLFPDGADYAQASHWTGLRPMSPDGRPLIGRTPVRNLWLDTGHGPLGWTMGVGSGRLLAAMMMGAPPPIDPAPYAPGRFSWLEAHESVG
jgi:D-amino-acid dehydrogenase